MTHRKILSGALGLGIAHFLGQPLLLVIEKMLIVVLANLAVYKEVTSKVIAYIILATLLGLLIHKLIWGKKK